MVLLMFYKISLGSSVWRSYITCSCCLRWCNGSDQERSCCPTSDINGWLRLFSKWNHFRHSSRNRFTVIFFTYVIEILSNIKLLFYLTKPQCTTNLPHKLHVVLFLGLHLHCPLWTFHIAYYRSGGKVAN